MEPIRVAVIDEQDIFRRGVVACLEGQAGLVVVREAASGPVPEEVDVAVVSLERAVRERFTCPLLVFVDSPAASHAAGRSNRVLGELPTRGLTPAKLVGATHAAASGLAVNLAEGDAPELDARSLAVLRMLAEGADTRRIARHLDCSPRTVKAIVSGIKSALHARSRAHAVAIGIRRGLI